MLATLIFENSTDMTVRKGPDCQDLEEFKDEQRKYNVLSKGNNPKISAVYTLYLCDSQEVQSNILSMESMDRVDAFFDNIINDLIIKNV